MNSKNKSQHPWYLALVIVIVLAIAGGLVLHRNWKVPRAKLVFATGQDGGIYKGLAAEFKRLIEKHLPAVSIELRPSDGSIENARLVKTGEADLSLIQNDIPVSSGVRAIAPIHKDYLHFLVRKDSGISGFRQLKGKSFTTGLPGSGSRPIIEALLDYFALTGETEVHAKSVTEGIEALKSGETPALILMLGFRSPAMVDLLRDSPEISMVRLPDKEVDALRGFIRSYPMCELDTLPPFSYGDQPSESLHALSIRTIFVARSDVPERVIQSITELIFSHRSELVHHHAAAAEMSETFSRSNISFPLHPGASQYFSKSEPGFLVRYAEAGAFILSLTIAAYGLLSAVRRWMVQRQKDRIDEYYIKVEDYLGLLEGNQSLSEVQLSEISQSLREIRRTAFLQLAGEKLIPDASFRIFQHLLEQCEGRITELRAGASG